MEQDIVKGRFLGTELGALEYVVRSINNGIRDLPIIPFTEGLELSEIPQTEEDKIFAREDMEMGCRNGIYEGISHREVQEKKVEGKMVPSAFVVWQGEGEEKKGRFVINFHKQSQHWSRGSVPLETLPSFVLELQQNDTLLSLEIKSGYPHFYLHPDMRDYFILRYEGRYYRCIALPFGWGRSVLWITKLLRPLVRHLREKFSYRVLPYIDDFLLAPSPPCRPSTPKDCARARKRLDGILARTVLTRTRSGGRAVNVWII